MKDHITEEEFLLEFFGNFGRDLGDPAQHYTNNPQDIFPFMAKCAKEKKPAFYSVQPRTAHGVVYGLEKLFFEFDWAHENEELTEEELEVRKAELPLEVKRFVSIIIEDFKMQPLMMKSRRGYHIYVYFDMVYQISKKEHLWKIVYRNLQQRFLTHYETKFMKPMKYCDDATFGDIKRLGRIPLSIHQKSGEKCVIVGADLKPDKLRSIAYYHLYGLKLRDLKQAVNFASRFLERKVKIAEKRKKFKNERWENVHGFIGAIRPCFKKCMDNGEMCHPQRLALLLEAYHTDDRYKTREGMIELFRCFGDFDGDNPSRSKCRNQVNWFFDQEKYRVNPYRCETIQSFGWCLYENCPIFCRRREKNADKNSN